MFKSIVLTALAGTLLAGFAQGAPSKGLQAVLLACWSSNSVSKMTDAVVASGIGEVELSLAP